MSRTRKQRERKLKAKMHEQNNKLAAMRRALSSQNDALVNYVQGTAAFGHEVLKHLVLIDYQKERFAYEALGRYVLDEAWARGFIKLYQNTGHYELTHCVKEDTNGAAQTTESAAQEPEHGP